MKLFTGWVLVAGLALGATAADAQVLGPSRVSDFSGPYSEAPYRGGPYYAPPPVAEVPTPRYGYGPSYGYGQGYEPAALLPPHEVYAILREAGFSPLGIPRQRGYVYTISVIDRGGEDGRLVIDARNGRIIRFTPAWQISRNYDGAYNSYGPPGLPSPARVAAVEPQPPVTAPRVASRAVPVPKPSPLVVSRASDPAKPAPVVAAKPAAEPPKQQAAIAQPKTAEAVPVPVAPVAEAKPAAPAIQPTQEMPKAQGLD